MTTLSPPDLTLIPQPAPVSKHAYDTVAVPFDWHDFLANQRLPGETYLINSVVRPLRALASGLEFKVTTAGVASGSSVAWPTSIGGTVTDGTVVWTAQALSSSSLRATIATSAFTAPSDLTLSSAGVQDLVYTELVGAGVSYYIYELAQKVTLSSGEQYEATATINVKD